jgi:hypothetical protein
MEELKFFTPAFVGFFIIQLPSASEVSNLENLKKVLLKICQEARLIPNGEMSILKLISPEPNCPAYGLSQQLTTSVISLDGWPEYHRVIIILHSCKYFKITGMRKAILSVYPQAEILRQKFIDWSI